MCGFAGMLNGDIRQPADPRLTDLMAAELRHRGPDNQGTFSDGPYAVSHQRLNIIDLTAAGRQPMQNETGNISLWT